MLASLAPSAKVGCRVADGLLMHTVELATVLSRPDRPVLNKICYPRVSRATCFIVRACPGNGNACSRVHPGSGNVYRSMFLRSCDFNMLGIRGYSLAEITPISIFGSRRCAEISHAGILKHRMQLQNLPKRQPQHKCKLCASTPAAQM